MIINTDGLRKASDDYFHWVTSVKRTRQQRSPFLLCLHREIRVIDRVSELLNWGDEFNVLQTWNGKYKDDIFHFTIGEFKAWLKNPEKRELVGYNFYG